MCKVCGCGDDEARIEGHAIVHRHHGVEEHDHRHRHDHVAEGVHVHGHDDAPADHVAQRTNGDLHFGNGAARAHAAGMAQTRLVQIEQDILAKNNRYAEQNRNRLADHGILALNLISSPGAGKTALLVATVAALKEHVPLAVIEGDQETANDAMRIRATGVPAIQINTGRGCHLDAHMVGHALDSLPLPTAGVLFIENVGNLVCPTGFDLGEAHKVAILSVAEGDDKPLKYPDAFAAADLMLLTKLDLLPHVDFDVAACIDHARRVNPGIDVIQLSARTGDGMTAWLDWVRVARRRTLEARAARLEAQLAEASARAAQPA